MLRLALLPDFREEHWPSMDLVADMLQGEIVAGRAGAVTAESLCPPYRNRFGRLPGLGRTRFARNADRLLNRMRDYPAHVRRLEHARFDAFHLCDHAYANLVHALPAQRTGVFCHDLDTFRCLLAPDKEPRPRWFKAMMRNVLAGMQKAAVVFHTTDMVRAQILDAGLLDAAKLVKVPLGVTDAYRPEPPPGQRDDVLSKELAGRPFLIHVGSAIPRKRLDVLFDVFAGLKQTFPDLILVKIGGEFSAAQHAQLTRLKLESALLHVGHLGSGAIAGLYRRAALLLQPSDAEGFGLPVLEALACGCRVVASAIPSLMEVGGEAATYCPVGAVDEWVHTVGRLLNDSDAPPGRAARLAQAAKYSWTAYAAAIVSAYQRLAGV